MENAFNELKKFMNKHYPLTPIASANITYNGEHIFLSNGNDMDDYQQFIEKLMDINYDALAAKSDFILNGIVKMGNGAILQRTLDENDCETWYEVTNNNQISFNLPKIQVDRIEMVNCREELIEMIDYVNLGRHIVAATINFKNRKIELSDGHNIPDNLSFWEELNNINYNPYKNGHPELIINGNVILSDGTKLVRVYDTKDCREKWVDRKEWLKGSSFDIESNKENEKEVIYYFYGQPHYEKKLEEVRDIIRNECANPFITFNQNMRFSEPDWMYIIINDECVATSFYSLQQYFQKVAKNINVEKYIKPYKAFTVIKNQSVLYDNDGTWELAIIRNYNNGFVMYEINSLGVYIQGTDESTILNKTQVIPLAKHEELLGTLVKDTPFEFETDFYFKE